MNVTTSFIFCALLFFNYNINSIKADSGDRWFNMSRVGFHHHGDPKPVLLDQPTAKKYFTTRHPFLSNDFQKNILPQLLKRASKQAFRPKKILPPKNPNCFAEVLKFNQKMVYITILKPLGGWRWHHYFQSLAIYKIERDKTIDTIFKLNDLYKKFSFTYQGVGHGMAASDPAVVKLGKPDYQYPSQSPSFGQRYYQKHHLHIVTHHFMIYSIEQKEPGWVKNMKDRKKEKYIACQGELKSYNDNYYWTENSESEHSSFTAPAATFNIIQPKKYQNRAVKIILDKTKNSDLIKKMSLTKKHHYKMVIPLAFFKSGADTIDLQHVTIEMID